MSVSFMKSTIGEDPLHFFKERGAVVFVSYCRFWESHGFVQQSLARTLVRSGVCVDWIDGSGWRSYSPVVVPPDPLLNVSQMPSLPLRRVRAIDRASLQLQRRWLKQRIAQYASPVVWIQGGVDEGLVSALPYIDVFSVFDDPYRHSPDGELSRRARLIICQNAFATNLYAQTNRQKTVHLLPPVDVSGPSSSSYDVSIPGDFPTRRLGYFGSCFSTGFDFDLLSWLVERFPDRGFLIAGRSDREGLSVMARLSRKKNFLYFGPLPKEAMPSLWRSIERSLLLYRPLATQDGAFPVKFLEGLAYGVDAVATATRKTGDLSKWILCTNDRLRLAEEIERPPLRKSVELGQEASAAEHLAAVSSGLTRA